MSAFPQTLTAEEADRRRREREDDLLLLLLAFTWRPQELAYYTRAGTRVPQRQVRAAVDALVGAVRDDVRAVTRSVVAGETDVGEWQDGVARRLKGMHVAAWAVASGGFENMSPAAVAELEGVLRFHLVKLEGFARDVAAGYTTVRSEQVNSETGEVQQVVRVVPMTERRTVARADMYVSAGGSDSYEGGRRLSATEAGYRFERNVLHPADHCPGCINETGRGWVSIGLLVPIGERDCKTLCRCSMAFARELPDSRDP